MSRSETTWLQHPKWVDSPLIDGFGISRIQNQVPTAIRTWRAGTVHIVISPIERISGHNCD
jgi:hypothetical protein